MSRSDFSLASLRASAEHSERCIPGATDKALFCELKLAASDVQKVLAAEEARGACRFGVHKAANEEPSSIDQLH